MNEIKAYQKARRAMELLCAEKDLGCRFCCGDKPLRMVLTPFQGVGSQMSLLENLERRGMSPNARVVLTYDGDVTYAFEQQFAISESDRKKLLKGFMTLCQAWRDLLFWYLHDRGVVMLKDLEEIQSWAASEEADT